MPVSEELKARFQADRFAAKTGSVIREAEPGRAVCALTLTPDHMNANLTPMGGAVFTLADFAFAVASNGFSDRVTVSRQCSITFLSPAKGGELIAEASCIRAGRRSCFYEVRVTDELGTLVAHVTVNGYTL